MGNSSSGKTKKQIREAFRLAVFTRDGFKCRICGTHGDLDAHHITNRNQMPEGGYVVENGIALCAKHHIDAEDAWCTQQNGKKMPVELAQFSPENLYRIIGSSKELARRKSMRL